MKSAVGALAVASAFTAVYAQSSATPIIQSPASLVVCQPALLSFSGGTAPYYISVLPGGQASAAALEQFPAISGNSYTWTVNLAAGQQITLAIRDSTGAINYSSELPIQAGTDTSCIGQSITGTGSSTPGGASTTGASNSLSSVSRTSVTSSSPTSSASSSSVSNAAGTVSSGVSSVASQISSGGSSVVSAASSAAAAVTSAVTGAASTQYMVNIAGVAGVAGLVAFLA